MGEKGVMAMVDDVEEGMQCGEHPYRTNPGGICAFCLQEKLGKLVSSSNPSPSFFPLPATLPPSSSNSSSPTFRSDFGAATVGVAGRNKIPFLSAVGQKKKSNLSSSSGGNGNGNGNGNGVFVLKRSKSVAPRPNREIGIGSIVEDSPRKKSFWSFFYLSSATNSSTSASTINKRRSTDVHPKIHQQHQEETPVDDEQVNKAGEQEASEGSQRKVARSRSVGCGSRRFSGDFLERISTGFGDCTLRRVESQRETNKNGKDTKMVTEHQIKERMKCGGIFGGFGMISSYWLSAADVDGFGSTSSRMSSSGRAGGRNRSWAWTFSSPMRAFRPVSTSKSFGSANSGSKSKIGNGNLSSLAVGR